MKNAKVGHLFGTKGCMEIILSHDVAKEKLGIFRALFKYPLVVATKYFGFPPKLSPNETAIENIVFYNLIKDDPKDFLEIGSGYGRWALSVCKSTGGSGVCVDADVKDIETMELLSKELNLTCLGIGKDIFECKFEKEKFDLIFAIELMEHIKDDRELLELIYSWLRPGGKFIFQTPFHFKQLPDKTSHRFGHVRNGYSQQSFEAINNGLFSFEYHELGTRKKCNYCTNFTTKPHPLKLIGIGRKK